MRDLLQAICEQAVKDTEIGRQAGANIGNLLLVACLEDALNCIIQD